MKKQPMISVIILCYNYGHMLGRALEACAAQTYRDFEIVMVNNGSTDNTEQVFNSFCQAHPDVKTVYVHPDPNIGILRGWNAGLRAANGTFVMFNDADDWMEPSCMEMLVQRAQETGADRVVSAYQEVDADGNIRRVRMPAKGARLMTTMLQGTIFRREIITKNVIFYDEGAKLFIAHDAWYICKFTLCENNRAQRIDKVLYNYFVHADSASHIKPDAQSTYEIFARPYIDFTKGLMQKTQDAELKTEMEYLLLRNLFASYIGTYSYGKKSESDKYYLMVRKTLKTELPGYHRNRMLWRINNGYEKGGTCGAIAVGLLDFFKAKELIWLLAQCGRSSKMIGGNRKKSK